MRFILIPFLTLVLAVTYLSAQVQLIHIEDFETEGESTRYSRSHQFDSIGSFFKRGTQSDFLNAGFTTTNVQKSHFFAIQNPHRDDDAGVALGAPTDGLCTLTIKDLNISNYSILYINYFLSAKDIGIYGPRRFNTAGLFINVDYQIDGSPWTNLAKISNANSSANTPIYYTNIPRNVAIPGVDLKLVEAFTQVSDTIANPGPGNILRIRFVFKGNNAQKMLALDKIRVYGTPISVLPANRVRLLHEYCGYTTNNLNDNIWCVNEGAESYDFEFSGGDLSVPVVENSTQPFVNLRNVTGLNYGQTYTVRVRGVFGGAPGPYSDSWYNTCQIQITNEPPQVQGCGSSITFFSNISSQNMGNATNYRFRINSLDTFETGGNRFFTLNDAGFSSNGAYNIEISALIDGLWTSFGNVCTFNVSGGAPTINVVNYQCGRTYNNLESYLQTTDVVGATNYQWSITGGLTQTISSGNVNKLRLADIPGMSYGVGTINVRVRATVGGFTGNYGSFCEITIDNFIPSTSFNSWVCNTFVDSSRYVCANPVGLADAYSLKLIDPDGDSSFVTKTNGCVQMQEFSNFSALGTYQIFARAIYLGDSSSSSPLCELTYSSGMKVGRSLTKSIPPILNDVMVYPNPTNGNVIISLPNSDTEHLMTGFSLYNTLGTEILNGTFNGKSVSLDITGYDNGIYILILSNSGVYKTVRIVKQ